MRLWEFLKRLKEEWSDDQVDNTAAALTFYGILALFPFLLFLVSLAGVLVDPSTWDALLTELSQVAPESAVQILRNRIDSLAESSGVGILTVGAVGAVWAASSGFAALAYALDKVYDVPESRPFWKVRIIAIAATIAAGFLSILASAMMVLTPALTGRLPEPWGSVLLWLRLPAAGLVMIFVLTLLYNLLPNRRRRFRLITPGSVLAVLLWLLVSYGFSLYVRYFGSYDVTYGALGGVIILLLWMWLSSIALLLGAEVNSILLQMRQEAREGPRAAPSSQPAEKGEPVRPAPAEEGRPARPARPARGLFKSALWASLLVLGGRAFTKTPLGREPL